MKKVIIVVTFFFTGIAASAQNPDFSKPPLSISALGGVYVTNYNQISTYLGYLQSGIAGLNTKFSTTDQVIAYATTKWQELYGAIPQTINYSFVRSYFDNLKATGVKTYNPAHLSAYSKNFQTLFQSMMAGIGSATDLSTFDNYLLNYVNLLNRYSLTVSEKGVFRISL
jgi:hypothetical protein